MKIFFEKIFQPRHPDPSFCSINPVFNLVPRALFPGLGVGRESPPPKAGKSAQRTRLSRIKNSDGIFLASCSPSPLIIVSTSPPFCSGSKILDSEKPTVGSTRTLLAHSPRSEMEERANQISVGVLWSCLLRSTALLLYKAFCIDSVVNPGQGPGGPVPLILRQD